MYDRLNHAVIVFKTLKKIRSFDYSYSVVIIIFSVRFRNLPRLVKIDRHSDGDAYLPVHCDVILHGADAGRNDGASLVWGCKFFFMPLLHIA